MIGEPCGDQRCVAAFFRPHGQNLDPKRRHLRDYLRLDFFSTVRRKRLAVLIPVVDLFEEGDGTDDSAHDDGTEEA